MLYPGSRYGDTEAAFLTFALSQQYQEDKHTSEALEVRILSLLMHRRLHLAHLYFSAFMQTEN